VFVYAPRQERLERLLHRDLRLSKAEAERKLIAEDETRAAYVRDHYGENWENHHLYHLMLSSSLGEREATSIVLSALHLAHTRPAMET
jgi:cytidylate kinase